MPLSQEISIGRLFQHDPVYSRTIADTYVSQASHRDRGQQNLILIIELPRSNYSDNSIVDTIINTADKAFNQSEASSPELVLEHTLESLNLTLPEIAPHNARVWLQNMNLLVGISEHGQIHFSNIGTLSALLLQKNNIIAINDEVQALNPVKIFANITSGVINPGDALLFTTASLIDYISDNKLKTILLGSTLDKAIQELEHLLSDVPQHVTFASVIVKFDSGQEPGHVVQDERYAAIPIRQERQQETLHTRDRRDAPTDTRRMHEQRRRHARSNKYGSSRSINGLKRFLSYLLTNIINYFKLLGSIVKRIITSIIIAGKAVVYAKNRSELEQTLIADTEKHFAMKKSRLSELSKLQKIALSILTLVIFMFLHLLIFNDQDRHIVETTDKYYDTLLAITEKNAQAENAILYQDEAAAELFYLEIASMLHALQPQDKKQKDQVMDLIDQNNRELNTVRHINYITNPLVYASFDTLEKTTQHFVLSNDHLIFDADQSLYSYSDADNVQLRSDLPVHMNHLLYNGDNDTIYALSSEDAYQVNEANLTQLNLDLHKDNTSLDEALIYNNNLYILDKAQGAIYKYTGNGINFRAGTIWLQDNELLKNVYHFAIDGAIYLTTTNGEIIKLFRSERAAFTYHRPNPPLGRSTKIYTSELSANLYLLDTENERVAILTKEGAIKDQFTSPVFNDLKSLAINATEDTIYVLNGNTIYLLAIKQ